MAGTQSSAGKRRLAVVMDDIAAIKPAKDSTLAMMLCAQERGWQLFCAAKEELDIKNGRAHMIAHPVTVRDQAQDWYSRGEPSRRPLSDFAAVLMRSDPPFDNNYLHATHILQRAEEEGVLVLNRPRALRDHNEKIAATEFPELCPETLVTSNIGQVLEFARELGEVVLKPLDAMGGFSIFHLKADDPNLKVAAEVMTGGGRTPIMAQRFLEEISDGDRRVLLVNGETVDDWALARYAAEGESRANLAAGGAGRAERLNERERAAVAVIGPKLRERGLWFVGLDFIGGLVSEINVTSPTCIREIRRDTGVDVAASLFDFIEARLAGR